jgi:hypothetical protein
MATASPDSPVYAQSVSHERTQTSPRDQPRAFDILTEPMPFPGTELQCFGFVDHTKNTLRQAISTALRDPGDPPGPLGFPGPQPTSIDSKSHFETIRTGRYGVATKTDGVRACLFMYDISPGVHLLSLFDRKMDQPYGVFIQHVPNALCQGHGTILDGELVKNIATGRWTFLVFDVVMLASFPQFHKPFMERMSGIEAALRMAYHPADRDTIVLDIKRFVPLNEAPLNGAHLNDPRFKNDGFVFMPYDDPIVFGHHEKLFKLKTTHSIDFLYRGGVLMIYNQSSKRYVKAGTLDQPADIPDGVIVECVLHTYHVSPAKRVWKLLMVRPDKDKSNSSHVLEKTLVNIRENLRYGDIRQLQ